jgi:hypothetical protein
VLGPHAASCRHAAAAGRLDEKKRLAVGLMNGMLQLMSSHLDKDPIIIDSLLHVSAIAWSPDGSVLLVAGTTKLVEGNSKEALAVKFYSHTGCLLHQTKVPSGCKAAGASQLQPGASQNAPTPWVSSGWRVGRRLQTVCLSTPWG